MEYVTNIFNIEFIDESSSVENHKNSINHESSKQKRYQ